MSYLFFEDVLSELGHKLTYDAIVNYAGNSFCEKSWDMIVKHNPMSLGEDGNGSMKNLVDFFNGAEVKVGKPAMRGKKK